MFYNFKLTKKGLKFIDKTLHRNNKAGILSITKAQLDDINKEAIINMDKVEEAL